MNSAEVIPNHKQSNSRFQVKEFLADSVRLSGKAPNVHSYGQVSAFNMRSRDARKIGASRSHLGDCCNDSAAAVPFWACFRAPIDFLKLGKMNIGTVPLFDSTDITAQCVTGDLVGSHRSLAQVFDEL